MQPRSHRAASGHGGPNVPDHQGRQTWAAPGLGGIDILIDATVNESSTSPRPPRSRWLSSGAIKLHIAAFFAIAAMLGLGWWQLQRAMGGNARSWAYMIMWPLFACYAGYVWWKLLQDEPGFKTEATSSPERTDVGNNET